MANISFFSLEPCSVNYKALLFDCKLLSRLWPSALHGNAPKSEALDFRTWIVFEFSKKDELVKISKNAVMVFVMTSTNSPCSGKPNIVTRRTGNYGT